MFTSILWICLVTTGSRPLPALTSQVKLLYFYPILNLLFLHFILRVSQSDLSHFLQQIFIDLLNDTCGILEACEKSVFLRWKIAMKYRKWYF